jgi:hypothetical protein
VFNKKGGAGRRKKAAQENFGTNKTFFFFL